MFLPRWRFGLVWFAPRPSLAQFQFLELDVPEGHGHGLPAVQLPGDDAFLGVENPPGLATGFAL
jgi:hypothetical protein